MSIYSGRAALLAAVALVCPVGSALAAPYVSGVQVTGTTVSYVLNENADWLHLSINGAPTVALSPVRGVGTFQLSSPTDTFQIAAVKLDANGYTVPTGGTLAAVSAGLSQATALAGTRLLSSDSNILTRFNSVRGIAVNIDPKAGANFGTAYVANSAAGTAAAITSVVAARTLGDGLYALRADQSDATGNGNTAATGGITNWTTTASTSSPWKPKVGADHNVYISDFSDGTGTAWRMGPALTNGVNMLNGVGGPSAVPSTQNHGSTTAVYSTGSSANGDLVVYTIDEDLTSATNGSGTATNDKLSIWRYALGSTDSGFTGQATRVNAAPLLVNAQNSLQIGNDGKFYVSQNRSAGGEAGIFVLSPTGSVVFNSLTATRTLLANPTAVDIFRNVFGIAVSPDQSWLAAILNNSDIAVVPLVNGIPDIANRFIVDTGTDVNSGRDIAFDAAGNLHYVSSGQLYYKVLARGGSTSAITSFNGTSTSFAMVPEPGVALVGAGLALPLLGRRRKA